jgi:hypothetical protein
MKGTSLRITSAFHQWFVQQFGNRPGGNKSLEKLNHAVRNARWVLKQAEDLLRARELWEEQERAALYAWNAAPRPRTKKAVSRRRVSAMGGKARAAKLSPKRRKAIAQKAAKARWEK